MSETNAQNNAPKKKGKGFWKQYHKWVGLIFSVFILMFCFSGIVMNHRKAFSTCEVSRWWLPEGYHIKNWNNSIIKATQTLPDGRVIAYGGNGCWLTDSTLSDVKDFNKGLDEGADNHKISNIINLKNGSTWCAGLYSIYKLNNAKDGWDKVEIADNDDRITDIDAKGDTLVVLTRSHILVSAAPYTQFKQYQVKTPANYNNKVSMLKTVWWIHSGAIFGLPGRLIVDAIAVVLIVLCLTGIIYFILPYSIKHNNKKKNAKKANGEDVSALEASNKKQASTLRFSLKWHNRFGAWLLFFTLLISVTGMCLRPPFMVPLAITSTKPLPGSCFDTDNAFFDKMRGIRWDKHRNEWLLGTSNGFYKLADFDKVPVKCEGAPDISPMGLNVFCPASNSTWMIGSFSGMIIWNPTTGTQIDYFTGKAPEKKKFGPPVSIHTVTGYTKAKSGDAVFEYSKANTTLPKMPSVLEEQPMSLWNFALELHVGRCYEPFLGSILSTLFVFLSGLLLTLTIISGYIIYRRQFKRKKQETPKPDK